MFKISLLLSLVLSSILVSAVEYDWNIGWLSENPDGLHQRPVIAINGQWPPPTISAKVGEQITVRLTNRLVNETTGLHFHGLFQNGTNSMDGPTGVTQCQVGPGETFTQVFQVSSTIGNIHVITDVQISLPRSINQGRTGTILTTLHNTLMGFVGRC